MTTSTSTNTDSVREQLRAETIKRIRGIIASAKANGAPAAAIEALEASLKRIERNRGTSADHGRIGRALNAENQLR